MMSDALAQPDDAEALRQLLTHIYVGCTGWLPVPDDPDGIAWLDNLLDAAEGRPFDPDLTMPVDAAATRGPVRQDATLGEVRIGTEFMCGDRRWRCTDVGMRTVVAICVAPVEIETLHEDGARTRRTLTKAEAEAEGWFNGPPYGVLESVFDEYDLEGCEPVPAGV
jgi:hypothetical protein